MTGLVGIVGDGSLAELRTMAARMAYRGTHVNAWSPASGVYLAEVGNSTNLSAGGMLALDSTGALYPQPAGGEAAESPHERLARALSQNAEAALLELRGSFSLAFRDQRDGSVLLACDRHCYKTLYYVELPGRVAFASDYKALLALADCPAAVDRDTLQAYLLTLECPEDRALLQQVKPLAAARLLRIGRRTVAAAALLDQAAQRQRAGLRSIRAGTSSPTGIRRYADDSWASAHWPDAQRRPGFGGPAGPGENVRPDLEVAGYAVGASAGRSGGSRRAGSGAAFRYRAPHPRL